MKLKTKDYIFILIVIVGSALLLYQNFFQKQDEQEISQEQFVMEIGTATLEIKVADTAQERYEGLSGDEFLDQNQGLLFVHEEPGKHGYEMRDMMFDLDFLFIHDEKVVDIARNVAKSFRGTVRGEADYNMVLEVNADWAKRNNVSIGDPVKIEKK